MGAELPPTEKLLADQRGRWRRGDRVRVEQLVAQRPGLRDQTEVLLDLIYGEVVLRREAGERPNLSEYLDRFPTLADPIRVQFEVDEAISPTRLGDPGSATEPPGRPAPPPPTAPPGYEIVRELGRGGMGVVYLARQIKLDRLVALKMIRSGELADPAERARFDAEARAAARLSHPNVVQVYEVGEHAGRPYLALEYVPGGTLADVLQGPPLAPRVAAALAATLARAVEHAHTQGVVHRDLKPANILLSGVGGQGSGVNDDTVLTPDSRPLTPGSAVTGAGLLTPKVTDFGLAKHLGSDGLTRTGDFVGTPTHASPEQAGGRPIGPAADVWALGVVLYQMLTGRPPFVGDSPVETLDQVRFADPVPPSRLRRNLPRDLETIALACLRKDPARRYPSAAALADDLDRFLNGQPVRARPVGAVEQAAKWCRRRPALAGTLAALVVLGVASLATVTALWQRAVRARDAEGVARQKEATALANERAERERTEVRSAELLIANARYAWLTDDLDTARRVLAECPPEYRTADWADLHRACSAARLVIPSSGSPVELLAYDPAGGVLAGLTLNGRLLSWDAANGKELAAVQVCQFGSRQACAGLAFTASGRLVVAGTGFLDKGGRANLGLECRAYDPRTGHAVTDWRRTDAPAANLSPDGRRLALVVKPDPTVHVFDTETGTEQYKLPLTAEDFVGAYFSVGGQVLVTKKLAGGLAVWDAATGKPVRQFPAAVTQDMSLFNVVAVDADGRRAFGVLYKSNAPATQLLVVNPDRELLRVDTPLALIYGFALTPDGRLFAAFGREKVGLPVLDAATGKERAMLRGFPTAVRSLAFRPDGRELAASYQDGRVVLWSVDP
jgi:eukaryotic-like serine/threonine-protein kinase